MLFKGSKRAIRAFGRALPQTVSAAAVSRCRHISQSSTALVTNKSNYPLRRINSVWIRQNCGKVHEKSFRYYSSSVSESHTLAESDQIPAGKTSFNYVMMNLYTDPAYCTDYVAETFIYTLFHSAHPDKYRLAGEWFGAAMLEYRHRCEDWLGLVCFYLYQSSGSFFRAVEDSDLEKMSTALLYACEIALEEPVVKDWVKSFSQTPMVRQRFPVAFEQSHQLLEDGKLSTIIGAMSPREVFQFTSDSSNTRGVAESMSKTAALWKDAQWARFFVSGDKVALRNVIAAASNFDPSLDQNGHVDKLQREGKYIEAARFEAYRAAMMSLFALAYQHQSVRSAVIDTADSESNKLKSKAPEDSSLAAQRTRIIAACLAAAKFAKEQHQKRGPYKASKAISSENASSNTEFRTYSLLNDEPSLLLRLGADSERDVILARYRELVNAEDLPESVYNEPELMQKYKGKQLFEELFRIKDKWISARDYPPQFELEAEKLNCIDDITKAMCLIAINCDEVRVVDPFAAAIIFQIGYNLDQPMSVLETADNVEPIADIFFKKALDLNPKSGLFWTTYGIHLAQTRRADTSIWALKMAVACGDSTAYFPLSMQYYAQGEKQDALEALDKYAEIDQETRAHAEGVRPAMKSGELDMESPSFGLDSTK